MIGVALIQIAVGLGVGLRTPKQAEELEAQFTTAPALFRQPEVPRMEAVMKNFRLFKMIEIALAIIGLLHTYMLHEKMFWYAFGIGLLAQAGVMLVLDLLAEQRGDAYLNAVRSCIWDQ